MTFPTPATKTNCDASTDDPKQALLTDLATLVDKFNALLAAAAAAGPLAGSGITGAAASGAVTASGLTQSTARLLGRTTASTGAIEEISVVGATLLAGVLTITPGSTVPVRQTVLSGPVDSGGLPNFGGSTGSTTVTMSGTLIATAANGFGSNGASDAVGSGTNLSWTGLNTNGTMYLGVKIANGVLTTFSTTVAPVYEFGGTPPVTNGAFTFNIQAMQNYLGNGTSADATQNAVIVGEVTVAGGVVSAITWYALQGRYLSAYTGSLPSANTVSSVPANIGCVPLADPVLFGKCLDAAGEAGFSQYDITILGTIDYGYAGPNRVSYKLSKTTVSFNNANQGLGVVNQSTGSYAACSTAKWGWSLMVNRGW